MGLGVVCLGLGCSAGPIDVASLPSGSLTDSLVAHWTFDEGVGVVANDSSGNGRTGTIFGPGWSWVPGRFGSALHFSGVDQVTVPGLPQATDSYSVSAWLFLASSDLIGPTSPVTNLLNTEVPGGGWALYATLSPGYTRYVYRYWIGPPLEYEMTPVTPCNCLILDSWVQLTAVVDATASSLTLYVNGIPEPAVMTSGAISPGSTMLYMARGPSQGYALTGTLDDVAIYDRALVPEEIALLGQAPAPDPQ
jgi:Concanavalin A-like lectin/glucanases superfamily